jgi:hypothetical protein
LPKRTIETLASVANLDDNDFDALAVAWSSTDEFDGWEEDEVNDLLREVGDLAETAKLKGSAVMLWMEL